MLKSYVKIRNCKFRAQKYTSHPHPSSGIPKPTRLSAASCVFPDMSNVGALSVTGKSLSLNSCQQFYLISFFFWKVVGFDLTKFIVLRDTDFPEVQRTHKILDHFLLQKGSPGV